MSDFTDEDVQRGVEALRSISGTHLGDGFCREGAAAILVAVLPEYRKRVLREAADWWATNGDQQAKETWAEVSAWLRARADAEEGK